MSSHSLVLSVPLDNQAYQGCCNGSLFIWEQGCGCSSEEQSCNIVPKRFVVCKCHHLGEGPCFFTHFLQLHLALQGPLLPEDPPPFSTPLTNLLAAEKQLFIVGV